MDALPLNNTADRTYLLIYSFIYLSMYLSIHVCIHYYFIIIILLFILDWSGKYTVYTILYTT